MSFLYLSQIPDYDVKPGFILALSGNGSATSCPAKRGSAISYDKKNG